MEQNNDVNLFVYGWSYLKLSVDHGETRAWEERIKLAVFYSKILWGCTWGWDYGLQIVVNKTVLWRDQISFLGFLFSSEAEFADLKVTEIINIPDNQPPVAPDYPRK